MAATKTKVTFTLSRPLVRALDEKAGVNGAKSRSAVLEGILMEWKYKEDMDWLNREAAEYYQNCTPEEIAEELEWAEFAGRAAAEVWKEMD